MAVIGGEAEIDFARLVVTFAGVFLSAALAVGSGIGGGSFFIALFILVLGLDAHHAIPLSKATIFGVGLAALSVNFFKRHPHTTHRTLIDYDLTVMFEPITLCGTLVGVVLNVLFPNYLVLGPLVLLLSYTTYKTFLKGRALAAKERAVLEASAAESEALSKEVDVDLSAAMDVGCPEDDVVALRLREDESARCRPRPLAFLGLMWSAFLISASLLYAVPSIHRCSLGWTSIFIATILLMLLITAVYGRSMVALTALKERVRYEFAPGEIHWTPARTWMYPACCFGVGLAAAGLGVGGGLLSGPLMLKLGVDPSVSAATSSFMIIFTSSASTLQYALLHKLSVHYALLFGAAGFAGGVVGQRVVSHVVAKHRKQSILVFLLSGVTLCSAVAIVVVEAVTGSLRNTSFNPGQVCG